MAFLKLWTYPSKCQCDNDQYNLFNRVFLVSFVFQPVELHHINVIKVESKIHKIHSNLFLLTEKFAIKLYQRKNFCATNSLSRLMDVLTRILYITCEHSLR